MCQVHLVPEIEELRIAQRQLVCGDCRRRIKKGSTYRYVEGPLDDESEERFRFIAHEDCYRLMISDVGDDGCFTWTGAEPVGENCRS